MENAFNMAIKLGDAAFVSEGVAELSRVIRVVANKIEHGETVGNIKDINGNTVGTFEVTKPVYVTGEEEIDW